MLHQPGLVAAVVWWGTGGGHLLPTSDVNGAEGASREVSRVQENVGKLTFPVLLPI